MARINLSIPDATKSAMDALETVNWSEVARAAFDREIATATFDGDNMDNVIERLRASKRDLEAKQRDEGLNDGREWAKNAASYSDLKRLAKLWDDIDDGVTHYDEDDETALAARVDARLKRNTKDEGKEASFWFDPSESIYSVPQNVYVLSFLEGASDIWDQVAEKV